MENFKKFILNIPAAIVKGSPRNGAQEMSRLQTPYFCEYSIAFLPLLDFFSLGMSGLPMR